MGCQNPLHFFWFTMKFHNHYHIDIYMFKTFKTKVFLKNENSSFTSRTKDHLWFKRLPTCWSFFNKIVGDKPPCFDGNLLHPSYFNLLHTHCQIGTFKWDLAWNGTFLFIISHFFKKLHERVKMDLRTQRNCLKYFWEFSM